jgi:hypothetical protein
MSRLQRNFGRKRLLIQDVKFFAGFEANRFSGSDADLGAGTGIPPDTGFAGTDVEHAETSQFNPLSLRQRLLEALEDRVHRGFRFVALEARALNHLVNDVLFYQDFLPSGELPDSVVIVESFSGIVNVARNP